MMLALALTAIVYFHPFRPGSDYARVRCDNPSAMAHYSVATDRLYIKGLYVPTFKPDQRGFSDAGNRVLCVVA